MEDLYIAHRIIRRLAGWGVWAFFTRVHVLGGQNVPDDGPLILTATHHNMMLDPAVLSSTLPNQRILHYWSKASLFGNPLVKYILVSSGNIAVDRKSKDRMALYKGTFECLGEGKAVALFPEGTSYTEPRIMQVKDGASWAALEYMKWAKENPDKVTKKPVVIVPAAIVYTNKSKYKSDVVVEFCEPITMDSYMEDFMSSAEGAPRSAVKRLTRDIEQALVQSTVNAPDWDTSYATRMARDMLWKDDKSINLAEFVPISQTLVDLFSTPDVTPNCNMVKKRLLEYYSLLQSARLTHSVLSSLPLPPTLDPSQPVPLPSRIYTVSLLLRDTLSLVIRIPFFLFPLIVHLPVYLMGRLGARLVEHEEETQAQNKVVFGLLMMIMIYPAAFFFLWAFMWYTPVGALVSVGVVCMFALYHNQLINDNYERGKRLLAAWRVLVGVWAPKKWDMSLTALSQYTTPIIPPENPWIQRPTTPTPGAVTSPDVPAKPSSVSGSSEEKKKPRKPPSRKLIRHVLRARAEAVRALVSFFTQLEKAEDGRVKSSPHLARIYGTLDTTNNKGWRSAREVVSFLRNRGASLAGLEKSIKVEGEWAAELLSSDWESEGVTTGKEDDIVWVPASPRS